MRYLRDISPPKRKKLILSRRPRVPTSKSPSNVIIPHTYHSEKHSLHCRGTQATVLRLGLGAGLHFFCLESIRGALETEQPDGSRRLSNLAAMASGGLSRALASALLCPVTVVKTRMENVTAVGTRGPTAYLNVGQALTSIATTEGPRGLFRGIVPTVLANAPFSAFYYLFYTRLREHLAPHVPNATAVNAASSTVAAMGATLLTQPMDVLRTRMQLGTGVTSPSNMGLNSFKQMARIMKKEGGTAMLVGIGPRFFKRTLQSALVWTLYEELMPRLSAGLAWAGPPGGVSNADRP